jgi:hypothetical protein
MESDALVTSEKMGYLVYKHLRYQMTVWNACFKNRPSE